MVRVSSGAHARRMCPISITVESLPERCELSRDGRRRPSASQVEAIGAGFRLWWIIDAQPRDSIATYQLRTDGRRRRSPVRAFARVGPAGWLLGPREAPHAEFLCPDHGAPTLTLLAGEKIAATVRVRSGIDDYRPRRVVDPTVAQGPVFASVAAAFHHLDRDHRSHWTESFVVRSFAGLSELRCIDLEIGWHATAGALCLNTGSKPPFAPIITAFFPDSTSKCLQSCPGFLDIDDSAARPSPFVVHDGGKWCVAMLCSSTSFGWPPLWRCESPASLFATPRVSPDGHTPSSFRVTLGRVIRLRYRFLVFTAADPIRFCTARYVDFDNPPLAFWADDDD